MNILSYFSKHFGIGYIMVTGAVVLTVFSGCMQTCGQFSRDADINHAFKNGDILTDLNYYYSGRHAVIGVDAGYTVSSQFWTVFEPQPDQLKSMRTKVYGNYGYAPSGSYMLAPDGTVIGVWFYGPQVRSFRVDQQKRMVEVMYVIPNRP